MCVCVCVCVYVCACVCLVVDDEEKELAQRNGSMPHGTCLSSEHIQIGLTKTVLNPSIQVHVLCNIMCMLDHFK